MASVESITQTIKLIFHIMDYTIVWGNNPEELIKRVRELIEAGWETEGGVAIGTDGRLYQALIRFDNEFDEYETGQEL